MPGGGLKRYLTMIRVDKCGSIAEETIREGRARG